MSVDIIELKELVNNCLRDEPAYCTNACPLNVDVKSFLEKTKNNKLNAAYRIYQNTVLFPQIVSAICDEPCREKCMRASFGGSINIKKIEEACCRHTMKKNGNDYYIPEKNKIIGVIGGGLSGIGCALKLSQRGYCIKLYEKEERLGGNLWRQLTSSFTQEVLEGELQKIFEAERIEVFLKYEVKSLNELNCDAIYVATGKEGNRFGLNSRFNENGLASNKNGIFLNLEEKESDSTIESLRNGILVATEIESFLKVGRMDCQNALYSRKESGLKIPQKDIIYNVAENHGNECFSKEEAVKEAERCLFCGCSACLDGCEMLSKYKKFPEKVIEDVNATLNVMEGYTVRIASRQINSCNLCGNCKQECPTGFDFKNIFLESRRQMQKAGDIPPAYHTFWLRDMEHALSERSYALLKKEKTCEYLFFPGCQIGASDSEYVVRTYKYLENNLKNVGIMLSCCGAPAYWAGDDDTFQKVIGLLFEEWLNMGKPVIVIACPSCGKLVKEYLPSCQIVSVYEIMSQYGLNKVMEYSNVCAVFDPCVSRGFPEMQQSARNIIKWCGINIQELNKYGQNAQCCGYGGQIHAVDMELMEEIVQNRILESQNDYITYCTNCRDTFAAAGKNACHILDLLLESDLNIRMRRSVPSLSQRRKNREKAKQSMELYFGITNEIVCEEKMKLYITKDLEEKMNKELILEEDALNVIQFCENNNQKLRNNDTGHYIGHLKQNYMTYWVEYSPEAEGYRLFNIYCHRMNIEEELLD